MTMFREQHRASVCRNYRRAGEVEKESGKQRGDKFVQIKYPLDTFGRHCRRIAKWTEDFMASCSRIPILPNGWRQLRTPLTQHPDPELEKQQMKQLKAVCPAGEDGYLDTYYLINDQDMILQTLRTTMRPVLLRSSDRHAP